jgi:uncharacterized membrane protein YdjX (TVP38/TMEM64 family)
VNALWIESMRSPARVVLLLVVLGLAFFGLREIDPDRYLNPAQVRELLGASGALAPFTMIAVMAVVVMTPIPSLPVDIAAGAYFGPWLGTLYAATGAVIGASMSFAIARRLGRDLVERVVGGHISFCTTCSDRLLTRLVLVARLIPIVSFKVVSYGAGLTKMSLGRFALATFFGMLPLTFVYVSAGRLLGGGGRLPIVAGVMVVAALLALPMAVERFDILGLRAVFQHDPHTPAGIGERAECSGSENLDT